MSARDRFKNNKNMSRIRVWSVWAAKFDINLLRAICVRIARDDLIVMTIQLRNQTNLLVDVFRLIGVYF